MKQFLEKYQTKTTGTLEMFDRMIFKGHLLSFFPESGRNYFLSYHKVLLKNFGAYAQKVSNRIKKHAEVIAGKERRPYIYLTSNRESKEAIAKRFIKKDSLKNGLVCVLTSVEPCMAFDVRPNKGKKKLELIRRQRKCLFNYFYYLDPRFGLMHVRLQTWFPFQVQIYINGREWLARQFDKKGINYEKYDNTFLRIDNIKEAQKIAKRFESLNLARIFHSFVSRINPFLPEIKKVFPDGYYWVLDQGEFATDIMFKNRSALTEIFSDLMNKAFFNFQPKDVMSFLGRKLHGNFQGEVVSSKIGRQQGFRIKHRMKKNSIKMYDKHSVLRIETTINDPREFKVFREVNRNGQSVKRWVPMGKSVFNLHHYARVSQSANHRYLNALAAFTPVGHCIKEIEQFAQPVIRSSNRFAGFNPLLPETTKTISAVLNGSHLINGFRNKDLQNLLFENPAKTVQETKKRSGKITRLVRKLRAHRLIKKVPRSHKYQIVTKGHRVLGACLAIKNDVLTEQAEFWQWQ